MSWGTCYKGFNNIHFNYPPMMNDTRNFSSYIPGVALDNKLKKEANIKTNSDYRKYLQTNGFSLIKNNQMNACDQCSSCPYSHSLHKKENNLIKQTNGPYIFDTILSNDQPFGYETSDLKNLYLSRQQINATRYAPRLQLNA